MKEGLLKSVKLSVNADMKKRSLSFAMIHFEFIVRSFASAGSKIFTSPSRFIEKINQVETICWNHADALSE
ncbi:CLUMA_CG007194, isoform A [Clunio marinus]|uniref:CLUMA_CG007194, isoform A n=1 Tax=Clunio marinus TaxID=568069 RepID=A0A1J1I5L2_9DIPT|nr:CLUMA_CG007194, isoform A [Clunio marinus]